MDDDLKKFQNIYQQQKSTSIDIEDLIIKLQSEDQKSKRDRIILLTTTPVTLIILLSFSHLIPGPYYLLAVGLIAMAMIMMIYQLFRSKSTTKASNSALDNTSYIEETITKLKIKMKTTSRHLWIYTFFVISAINVGYIEILKLMEISLEARILIHVMISLFLFLGMYFSVRARKKKHNIEVVPLIEILESMKA